MKIIMLADDITGANDSGVQFARCGWKTTVMFSLDEQWIKDHEVCIFDTDTRSMPAVDAFRHVKEKASFFKQHIPKPDIIYKKMDSTLRGNIGAEIDAIYEVFLPDFVIISPGYPANGRKVIDGICYLHGQALHETEIAKDPKTPVLKSSVLELLSEQSVHSIVQVPYSLFETDEQDFHAWLKEMSSLQMTHLVFDARTDEDLRKTVEWMARSGYSVVWAGSAGLANVLPHVYHRMATDQEVNINPSSNPVLLIVGSVSQVSRHQLAYVLKEADMNGIELDAIKVVESDESRIREVERVFLEAQSHSMLGKHIALFTTGDRSDIEKAHHIGKAQGISESEISIKISCALAEAAKLLISKQPLQGMVLTGGDTAKQLFTHLQVKGVELIDEIELGIPLGKIDVEHNINMVNQSKEVYVITKAGAFGKESSLLHAIRYLEGTEI